MRNENAFGHGTLLPHSGESRADELVLGSDSIVFLAFEEPSRTFYGLLGGTSFVKLQFFIFSLFSLVVVVAVVHLMSIV